MYIKKLIWELDNNNERASLVDELDWYEAGFNGVSYDFNQLITTLKHTYGADYTVIHDNETGIPKGISFITHELYNASLGTYIAQKTKVCIDIYISTTEPYTEYIERNIHIPVELKKI